MKKEVKDTIIAELGAKLKEYPHFYLVDLAGLNAEATSNLRRKCFKNEIKMIVVKNTLLREAFQAMRNPRTLLDSDFILLSGGNHRGTDFRYPG